MASPTYVRVSASGAEGGVLGRSGGVGVWVGGEFSWLIDEVSIIEDSQPWLFSFTPLAAVTRVHVLAQLQPSKMETEVEGVVRTRVATLIS